jgi:hypothetical protein
VLRRLLASLLASDAVEQDAAWQRAEALLDGSLNEHQREIYRSHGYVEVPSKVFPGRVYRVDGWRPVSVHEHGQFVGAVCIRPRDHLPGPDIVLARKLMLEGAELEFLRVGNWLSPAWRPAGVTPTLLLLVVLISPWLMQLRELGVAGLVTAIMLMSLPGLALWWRFRGRHHRPVPRIGEAPAEG